MQLDSCTDVTLRYAGAEHFDRVFSADVNNVRVEVGSGGLATMVDFTALQATTTTVVVER